MSHRLLSFFLIVFLLLVGVLPASASPEPPVAAADAAAWQPQAREYLMLPAETTGDGGQDADLMLGRFQPELAAAVRDGRLESFGAAPRLGAVLLVNPAPDLLAEARGFAGVAAVLPPNQAMARLAATPRPDTGRLQEARGPAGTYAGGRATPAAATRAAGVGSLSACSVYLGETRVEGSTASPGASLTLSLWRAGTVQSTVSTTSTSWNSFTAYFTATILAGDLVEVQIGSEPLVTIPVVNLTLEVDKPADLIRGNGPVGQTVQASVWNSLNSYSGSATVGPDGRFEIPTGSSYDIVAGDSLSVYHTNNDGFLTYLRNWRAPGVEVHYGTDYVYAYGKPGDPVALTLAAVSGVPKATGAVTLGSNGSASVRLTLVGSGAGNADIVPGDRLQAQIGSAAPFTLNVVAARVTGFDTAANTVTGSVPANGKVIVFARDDYQGSYGFRKSVAGTGGVFVVSYTGSVDLAPGSYAYVLYLDAADNMVSGDNLYAGPYVRVHLDDWSDLDAAGAALAPVSAVLRNALGAVKGTFSGTTSYEGLVSYGSFSDSAGNSVHPVPGDQLEVAIGATNASLTVAGLDLLVDRDADRVSGTGPANSTVRLVQPYGSGEVVTAADGTFTWQTNFLVGGYSLRASYRSPAGYDTTVYRLVPMISVDEDEDYVSVYGMLPRQPLVVKLLGPDRVLKSSYSAGTVSGTGNSSYGFSFSHPGIEPGDTVVMDSGSLHLEQEVVPLTIAGNTTTNVVFGTVPPNGWVNVFARRYFGPYSDGSSASFYASGSGDFATNFNGAVDLRGGYEMEVMYWEDGHHDQVRATRYVPYLQIDQADNTIRGYDTPGAAGAITVRNAGGTTKASIPVTASSSGYFYAAETGLDVLAGDRVQVELGELHRTVTVPPLSADMDVANDRVTGISLPNIRLGVTPSHWMPSYYTNWVNGQSLARFIDTDSSGSFIADYGGWVDLTLGDYTQLAYIDGDDNFHQALSYTTQPAVAVDSYPAAVQPGQAVEFTYTISGAHPQSTYVTWDTQSRPIDSGYSHWIYLGSSVAGRNVGRFYAPMGGTIYFRVYAYIDGRAVWSSSEGSVLVSGEVATTLIDPVSGTTNDATPTLTGVAAPNSQVSLYHGTAPASVLMTTTAGPDGYFAFDLTTPLDAGPHLFWAATVGGLPSNQVQLNVDTNLLVDPVHILLASHGATQHLRDEAGLANLGGRVWTRTGDTFSLSSPIGCNVYTAELYVGGVFAGTMVNQSGDVWYGSYTPVGSGNYALNLHVRCDGPSGPYHDIAILTGLIDPDGYVYDAAKGPDRRIAGAVVTCYELVDEATDTWRFWPAQLWNQANPWTTWSDGYYAFFTMPGKYKIKVTAPGYLPYESPVLTVTTEPVHHNAPLELTPRLYLPVIRR